MTDRTKAILLTPLLLAIALVLAIIAVKVWLVIADT